MLDNSEDPQNPKPENAVKLLTRLFSNTEQEETDIRLNERIVKPDQQLKVLHIETSSKPHVSGWEGGLYLVMTSLDLMRQFAVTHGTWAEEEDKGEEPDRLITVHFQLPPPRAFCQDSRRFASHLDEIEVLKFQKNATNKEIADRFQIKVKSVPRLIRQFFCFDKKRRDHLVA